MAQAGVETASWPLSGEPVHRFRSARGADQRPGKDAVERLKVMRKELDDRKKELDRIRQNHEKEAKEHH